MPSVLLARLALASIICKGYELMWGHVMGIQGAHTTHHTSYILVALQMLAMCIYY